MCRRSTITTLRWLLAAAILYPFVRRHLQRDWPLIRAHFGVLVYLSLLGGALFGALQFVGLQLTTALNVSVMNSLGPVFIGAASAVMFRDRLTGGQLAGIVVSLLGVLAIITQLDRERADASHVQHRRRHHPHQHGAVGRLFGVAALAAGDPSARASCSCSALISGVAMLPAFAWEHSTGFVLQPTVLTFAAIAFVTVFSTIAAFMFWTRGVELIGAEPGRGVPAPDPDLQRAADRRAARRAAALLSRGRLRADPARRVVRVAALKHDPEKHVLDADRGWTPVFGKDHASTRGTFASVGFHRE